MIKDQNLIGLLPWVIAIIVAALVALVFIVNLKFEARAKTNEGVAVELRIFRWILGAIFLVPALLTATGLDLSHMIGEYYATHGHEDAIYNSKGLLPSSGTLYIIVVSLSVALSIYLVILGRTPLWSTRSLLKLLLAGIIAAPIVFIIFMASFGANYQF
jgi:hypothetical protein